VVHESGGTDPGRRELKVRLLSPGKGAGRALRLQEGLSFWGGVDPDSGRIVDHRHPQRGDSVRGRVLLMPAARGSSSASSVLAECIRLGTAPAAVLLGEPDPILTVGALVAGELYGTGLPVGVVEWSSFNSVRNGDLLEVRPDGRVLVRSTSEPLEGEG